MATPDLKYAFKLPPEKAVEYFKSKGYTFSWDWHEVWQEAHAKAFTVAKVMRMDVLQDIRGEVQKALDEGTTFAQFRKELEPRLKAKGWWGKKVVGDKEGGRTVQLGSPYRLETIYRQNVQTAYMAGRYRAQMGNVADRPHWQYVAVLDSRTRPAHRILNGKVFRYDDPFWDSMYPPNGWRCRCRVRALDDGDMRDRWLTEESSEGELSTEEVRINAAGDKKAVTLYTDRETGLMMHPDVGWSYNPGKVAWKPDLAKYDPDIRKLYKEEPPAFDAARLKALPGTQKGSNPGGLYEDPDGRRYYVKFYKQPDQARGEWAAARIYREMGLESPELHLARMTGPSGKKQLALISEWRDDLKRLGPDEMLRHKAELAEAYQGAVLVKNWDVVGLDYDNLVLTGNKRLMVVDSGGAFRYRAQGGRKAYGADIEEVASLRNPKTNPQGANVFGKLFSQDVFAEADGARKVMNLTGERVSRIFADAGFSKKTAADLTESLMARRELLIDRYNLDGRYGRSLGKHVERFREWGTTAWEPKIINGLINGSTDSQFAPEVLELVTKFEEYINTTP
jgi:SPP1 gp7 family putative phage head morphogenesis protein